MNLLRTAKAFVRNRLAPREHRLLFAFTGGSAAWPAMGRTLYRRNDVFRESIEATGAIAERILGWSAASVFRGHDEPESTVAIERRNEIMHLGMLQIAQVDLWRDAGVRPGAVFSVSLGEMVAPYAAGAISREDSARVLASVAQAISRTASDELMFIVQADGKPARQLVRTAPVPMDFLGTMTPALSVLLGRERDAELLRAHLREVLVREIPSDWNYHTPSLDVDRAWLARQLRDVKSQPALCPIYSSAAGGVIRSGSRFDAQFYAWMVSRPFLFADALVAALRDGFDTIVTIGPHPANNSHMQQTAAALGSEVRLIDTMRAHEEIESFRKARTAVRALRVATPVAPRNDRGLDASRFAFYETLRARGPVHRLENEGYWLVVGYDEVQRALNDARTFSNAVPDHDAIDSVLLGSDPPQHTAVRRVVSRYFSNEAIARRLQLAERTAESLLRPLAEGRAIDVVCDLAQPLVLTIAADLIGASPDAVKTFLEISSRAAGDLVSQYASMREPIAELQSPMVAELRDEGFDDASARSLLRLFWIAGMTPQHAIAPAVLLLLEHDDARGAVQRDPSLLGAFVDESLRLYPPAHLVPRVAKTGAHLGGHGIPAGSLVQLGLAAANRDPSRFEQPSTLRLDRTFTEHLSFSGGVHRCLGASLGRGIIVAALRALFRVAPDFHAIQPLSTVRYASGTTLREIEQLVIGA
jgi:cytochrome P450/malonyl CoA-acyl carrier protein transacylase